METKRSSALLGIAVLLLTVTTIFFGYKYQQEKGAAVAMEVEKDAINQDYETLTEEFETLSDELAALEAENESLDTELQAKMEELETRREQVNSLIRTGGSSALKQAKEEIAALKADKLRLEEQVRQLIAENEALQLENESLASDLTQEKEVTKKLTAENVTLTVELVEVTEDRDRLIPIANYGQVIQLADLEATPVKMRRNGSERKAISSKNADKVRLCFQMEDNPVAMEGQQQYLIRLVTPEGSTVFEEQSGSGTFMGLEGEGELKYTAEAVVEFRNAEQNVCWYWDQTSEMQRGEYQAEVYHRGHKVGEEKFVL